MKVNGLGRLALAVGLLSLLGSAWAGAGDDSYERLERQRRDEQRETDRQIREQTERYERDRQDRRIRDQLDDIQRELERQRLRRER